MSESLRLLIVEDSEIDTRFLLRALQKGGYEPMSERVDTAETMKKALEEHTWDIVIADYVMPEFSGLGALEVLKETGIDLPFIMVSGQIGEETAVQAMKAGANDYVMKGNLARLVPAIERELLDADTRRQRRKAEEDRDRLAEQLRLVNGQLVQSNIKFQEQAEGASRRAAELDAVFDSVTEAVVICGAEGEIVRMNPVAADLLGLSTESDRKLFVEQLGLLRVETADGKPFPADLVPLVQALRGEAVRGVVMVIHTVADGKPLRVSVSATPIHSSDGKLVGAVTTLTDITAKHKLQHRTRA